LRHIIPFFNLFIMKLRITKENSVAFFTDFPW